MIGEILSLPVVRFFIVGGLVYLAGVVLLILLVEVFKVGKSQANLVMLLTTLQLSFLLNNFWSFEFVPVGSFVELLWRWVQYQIVRAVPLGLEQLGFIFLTKRGLPYLLASFLVVAAGFIFVFLISSGLIFVKR